MSSLFSALRLRRRPVACLPGTFAVGDRFIKPSEPHSAVWTIVELIEPVPGLPHARLSKDGGVHARERVTVSLLSLADARYYARYAVRPLAAAE